VTLLKNDWYAKKIFEAERSLDKLIEIRDNPDAPISEQRAAANDIIHHIAGKPRQVMEHAGQDGGPLTVNVVNYAADKPWTKDGH